ncbi:MAG: c-type cytochrome [Candidatus Walczuchella monophlebidarum]
MYKINCSICHGNTGDGQGVKKEKILGVPNYKNLEITVGSVYNVIMYGKNNMGSYASQLTPFFLWKVAEYVIKLKQQ